MPRRIALGIVRTFGALLLAAAPTRTVAQTRVAEDVDARERYFLLPRTYPFGTMRPDAWRRAVADVQARRTSLANLTMAAPLTWQPMGPAPITNPWGGANAGRINDLAVHPTNSAIIYVAANAGGVWRTTNGGNTWSSVYEEEKYHFNSVWFKDENTGWAAGYYHLTNGCKLPVINRTIDGGLTWQSVYTDDNPGDINGEQFIDIRFKNELEGFAVATYSQSVYTTDGGQTWHFTRDESNTEFIADWGIYKALDGFSELYLVGRKGCVTKWKQ